MDLADHRRGIDAIDRELLELFQRRLRIAGEIASYKHEHELPVLDSSREEQNLKLYREARNSLAHIEALDYAMVKQIW